jgi:Ser/Thr protein kinase RdoA (MazF antagonist)
MSPGVTIDTKILDPLAMRTYLETVLRAHVEIVALRALSGSVRGSTDPKDFGYGIPFEIDVLVDGEPRAFVVSRTRPAQGFGHDYAADRAWQALHGHHAYNTFPRHVRSLDVGLIRASGELVSVADAAEFFQLVEKADGDLYWLDLDRLLQGPAEALDVARAETLARFLADAHRDKRDEPTLYHRRIRELVGHGECLMGILDSYPHPYPFLPPDVCEEIERGAVGWRWRLRHREHRLSRVHGDFHPWNILFREGADFSLLDRSRGEWGEPADDVSALAINYLFFALRRREAAGAPAPLLDLFHVFLNAYLDASRDGELLEVLPPFLAFRALVIAHPRWYPALAPGTRTALVAFARRSMASQAFVPDEATALVRGER